MAPQPRAAGVRDAIVIPIKDFEQFKRWALDIIGFTVDRERGLAASRAVRRFLLPGEVPSPVRPPS